MIFAFIFIPLILALMTLSFRGAGLNIVASILAYLGLLVLAVCLFTPSLSEPFVLHLGGWGPDHGITWIVDGLAALMLGLSSLFSLLTLIYCGRRQLPYQLPLHHFLIFGVNGCFITADLFNLFVFFEVMLMASFVQVTLGGGTLRLRHGIPYVVLNLLASMLLLIGVGLVYSSAGSVNLGKLASIESYSLLYIAGMTLVFVVFSLKAALAPYFFWLPDAYPAAPASVASLFAALLTKVGVYALYRVLHLQPPAIVEAVQTWLLPASALTMLIGVLGAIGRNGFREILSFHIVSQIGYMIFALALGGVTAVAAGLFYMVHNMLAKTALFFVAGCSESVQASQGLRSSHGVLAVTFLVSGLSLAGLPPLGGFWAKFLVIRSGFQNEVWFISGIAVLVSLLTLASMLKIWNKYFLGEALGDRQNIPFNCQLPAVILSLLTVAMGLSAGVVFNYIEAIAAQIVDSQKYIDAVMSSGIK